MNVPGTTRPRSSLLAPLTAGLFALVLLTLVGGQPLPAAAQSPKVVISEFLASNGNSITDADGETSDWIELHNPGSTPVDLTGWRLVDSGSAWTLPSTSLGPGQHLIVWASGKDRTGAELHTDFKLKATGEYLALFDPLGTATGEFADYPEQSQDRAYGLGSNGVIGYLSPTPGHPNGAATAGRATAPTARHGRGIYTSAVAEILETTTTGATIRYTVDGTEPTEASTVYTNPIAVASTSAGITTLRAKAFAPGLDPSPESTWSYVFPAGRFATKPDAAAALSLRPVLSIHTATRQAPDSLDRIEARIEMIDPADDLDGFVVSAGFKRVGDTSISRISKPSWRVYFEPEYGDRSLTYPLFQGYGQGHIEPTEEFFRFDLHGGSFDAFQQGNFYLSDRFYKDAQLDMGGLAPHGRYVTVFLNGEFAGAYNLRERADHHFFATYGTGDPDDYETGKGFIARPYSQPAVFKDVENGTGDITEEVMRSSAYAAVADHVGDPRNLAILMATEVRAPINQCEVRVGVPIDPGHDDPLVLGRNDSDLELNKPTSTSGLTGCVYNEVGKQWLTEPEFAEAAEDALAHGFCPGGPLTAPKMRERLDEWVAEFGAVFPAEADRWGNRGWEAAMETIRARWTEENDAEVLAGLAAKGQLTSCDRRPQVATPPNMVVVVGQPVELVVEATDADGHTLSFAATGLPPGLSLDSEGAITGKPTTAGQWTNKNTVTDSSGDWTSTIVDWTVLANPDSAEDAPPVIVLNEFNAVGARADTWRGEDPAFGADPTNGGDWLELVTTGDADLRGFRIELWDRDRRSEELRQTAVFELSNAQVWSDVASGTLITIAEGAADDSTYDPTGGDWTIGVGSSAGAGGTLLTPTSQQNFDTNRHEMRVLIRDSAGLVASPFMGETERWSGAVGGNVGADEVMALCQAPDAADLVVDYHEQASVSSFGEANRCQIDGGFVDQYLGELRGVLVGDVDCDDSLAAADVTGTLEILIGIEAGEQCRNRHAADVDGDGTIALADARHLVRCVTGTSPCPE